MSATNASLAALIGSRICHDLISPIGAINNGLELLTMSGDPAGPEMNLIGESVGNASARIRFFRIAFGSAGDQLVGAAEVQSILRDLYGTGRRSVEWTPTEAQPRSAVRLAFLSILCLESAMPFGGTVKVEAEHSSWCLVGTADRLNADPDLWSLLAGQGTAPSLQPAHVQFALLPLIAQGDGRRVRSWVDDNQVTINF